MGEKKPRRRPGEGSIRSYQTTAGERFYIVYRIVDPATGDRKQKLERGGWTTETAARKALRERLVKVDKGEYVEPSRQRVSDYLDEWLDGLRLAPSTVVSYRRNVEQHVKPRIGSTPLAGVTGTMLTKLYRELERDGARKDGGTGGLSARTVRYVHTILHGAFGQAAKDGRLPANPVDRATPPSAKQATAPEMHVWDADELRAFLDWSANPENGDDLHIAWRLLAMTGMRRGELLALRWADIDLDARNLAVRRSMGVIKEAGAQRVAEGPTKTGKPRVVDIDPQTVAELKGYRSDRAENIGLQLVRDDAFVISHPDGAARHPERFSREFVRRLERCRRDLGDKAPSVIRLHDLRHTHATLLLKAGEPVKVVSERLGHATAMITLGVYAHVMPGMQADAAARFAGLIYGQPDAL